MLDTAMPPGLRRTVTISAGVHVGLLLVAIIVSSIRGSSSPPPQNVVTTKLVRLGKERPKELLPRKEAPPPPPAQKPPPAVVPAATAPSQPTETLPSAKDRIKELSKVASALNRLKQHSDEEPEGRPDGSPSGDAREAIIGNKFATEVYNCLKANYAVEGVDETKVRNKRATIVVRVAPDGRFIDSEIIVGSGLKAFDQAVERAVRRCGKVGPPDPLIRDSMKRDGIEVVFEP